MVHMITYAVTYAVSNIISVSRNGKGGLDLLNVIDINLIKLQQFIKMCTLFKLQATMNRTNSQVLTICQVVPWKQPRRIWVKVSHECRTWNTVIHVVLIWHGMITYADAPSVKDKSHCIRGCAISYCVHYTDVIMTTMASQITSLTVVYSTVYSDADQRKHQSSASLAFVWAIHRDRWIPRTKGQLLGKCFHLMTSSCLHYHYHGCRGISGFVTGHPCGDVGRWLTTCPSTSVHFWLIYSKQVGR